MNLTPDPSSKERGEPFFPLEKELEDSSVLDLRGLKCPMTFVKTKVALEELSDGQVLKILLDDKLASVDVPGNATREGHEVVQTKEVSPGVWEVLICKHGKCYNEPGRR
jgi:sulfite reductase (ferredoxin)